MHYVSYIHSIWCTWLYSLNVLMGDNLCLCPPGKTHAVPLRRGWTTSVDCLLSCQWTHFFEGQKTKRVEHMATTPVAVCTEWTVIACTFTHIDTYRYWSWHSSRRLKIEILKWHVVVMSKCWSPGLTYSIQKFQILFKYIHFLHTSSCGRLSVDTPLYIH